MLFLSIAYITSKAHCRRITDVITLGEKAHKLFPTNSVSVTISQGHSNCDHAMHYQHVLSERHSKVQRLSRSLSKTGDAVTSNAPLKTHSPSIDPRTLPLMSDAHWSYALTAQSIFESTLLTSNGPPSLRPPSPPLSEGSRTCSALCHASL